jgi:hypothetical protein
VEVAREAAQEAMAAPAATDAADWAALARAVVAEAVVADAGD